MHCRLNLFLLLLCLLCTGCRRELPSPEPSPATVRSTRAEEDSARFLELIRRLDFLLEGEDWQDPTEIDRVYLTQWYLRQWLLFQGEDGEFSTEPLTEPDHGLLLPQEELEAAVEESFGLSADWLRRENPTYRPDEAGYHPAGAAGNPRRTAIDLLSVQEEDGLLTLTFTLEGAAGQPLQTKALTVRTDTPSPRYQSLLTLN